MGFLIHRRHGNRALFVMWRYSRPGTRGQSIDLLSYIKLIIYNSLFYIVYLVFYDSSSVSASIHLTIAWHAGEDVDQLPIPVGIMLQPLPRAVDRAWQIPVLERRAIA